MTSYEYYCTWMKTSPPKFFTSYNDWVRKYRKNMMQIGHTYYIRDSIKCLT